MMKSINFQNRGLTIAANLYYPEDFDVIKAYPAILTMHPVGGVKEQTVTVYAQKLAEHGFIALTFDASYQGESTGEPWHLEDPYIRVEDIRSAINFLNTLDDIDTDRVGVLGICGAGLFTGGKQLKKHLEYKAKSAMDFKI